MRPTTHRSRARFFPSPSPTAVVTSLGGFEPGEAGGVEDQGALQLGDACFEVFGTALREHEGFFQALKRLAHAQTLPYPARMVRRCTRTAARSRALVPIVVLGAFHAAAAGERVRGEPAPGAFALHEHWWPGARTDTNTTEITTLDMPREPNRDEITRESDSEARWPGGDDAWADPPHGGETGPLETAARPKFGLAGQRWWTVSAGAGWDFDETVAVNALSVSWGNFLDDDFEWVVEGGAWGFSQPGDDALGGSLSTVFRWHAWNTDRWSAYFDLGIGLGLHSEPVPEGGTRYDFMPRAGVGLTRRIDDAGTRLVVGLRWQHWSNAHLEGDEDNPPLDTAAMYFGVMWQGR